MYNALEAKCPLCERTFSVVVEYEWSGRGKPRIHCARCKSRVRANRFLDQTDSYGLPQKIDKERN